MTEEAKTAETTAPPPATETKTEKPKPPGYEPVNFDELNLTPEQRSAIEPRIRYLYGNLKKGEAERTELRGYLDRLQKDIDERIKPLETAQTQTQEAQYTHAIKLARDEGRVEDELKLTKEFQKLGEPKPEPKKIEPDGIAPYKPQIEAWAAELDGDGNLKRPWLSPDHPEHITVKGWVMTLAEDWKSRGTDVTPQNLPVFLNQLEQKVAKPNGHAKTAAVLSTGQIKPPVAKSSDLTQEEKYVADKTMQHVKDPEERYRRYASHKRIRA